MKRLVFLLLLLATGTRAQTLTLDQAVEAAIAHNANVRNAQLEIEKGQTRVAAMRTKRLPSLTFNVLGGEALNRLGIEIEQGQFGTYEATGPVPNEDTRIEVARTFSMYGVARITQPVTQLHSINLGIKLNEASLAVDRERERAARIAITREVKSAYFQVLTAQSYANALRESVTAWEEVEREMNVRVSQKAVLEADRLDASARLAATRLAAQSAANSLATAKDQLAYLVGREVDVTGFSPCGADILVCAPEPPCADKSVCATRRPDVREAELRVEQARLDMRLKNAERIPEIALMVSSTTPINNDLLPSNMTSAGITMSYEPFTWGRRKAELTEKRRAVEQAENALRDRKSAAALEIAAYGRKVEEAAAQIAVRRLEAAASRERLRVTTTRFREQAARPDEMFSAGASLTQAAAREQEAVSAYWTARADYEKAIGQE